MILDVLYGDALLDAAENFDAETQKNTAVGGVKYSLKVEHSDGSVSILAPGDVNEEMMRNYLVLSRKGLIQNNAYFPVRAHTPRTLIATLQKAGISVADKPLAMQARKARQSQLEEQPYAKNGTIVRHHAMKPEEIIEVIEKLDSASAIIHQSDRTKKVVIDGETMMVDAPDNFAVFVTLDNGKECVAIVEFDSEIDKKYIMQDGHGEEYHTTVTVFEPNVERKGVPFDYIEYLLLRSGNKELEIVKESSETETANSETHATVSETKLSSNRLTQPNQEVKQKKSSRDPAQQKIQKALEQENAQLKEDVSRLEELLKLQRTVTGGTKFAKTSVEAAARMLKKHANVKRMANTSELAQLLHTFYEAVASDTKPSWDKIKEQARPVACF